MPRSDHIIFWLNAFIPAHVEGWTLSAPTDPNRSWLQPLKPRLAFDCYLTDAGREPGDPQGRQSRMHSELSLWIRDGVLERHEAHHVSGVSVEVECDTGEVDGSSRDSKANLSFAWNPELPPPPPTTPWGFLPHRRALARGVSFRRTNWIRFELEGSSSNSRMPAVVTPSIDYHGELIVHPGPRVVSFRGMVDDFPAFEAYVRVNGGPSQELFRRPVPPGGRPWDLWGGASNPVSGTVSY